jgi:hypothetical protein
MAERKEKLIKASDVVTLIDREITKFDYRNISILDELYAIRDALYDIPDARDLMGSPGR